MKVMKPPFNRLTLRGCLLSFAVAGALLLPHSSAQAQTEVYSQNFDADDSANWVLNTLGVGYSYANYYFDYSTVGIPSAPHSTGGTTRGLKLGTQLGVGASGSFPAGVTVSPTGFSITENFEMRFDMWLNTTKNTTQAAQFGGGGYGTAATTAQAAGATLDSVFVGASTDILGSGTAADYRMYGPNKVASYQDADRVISGDFSTPSVYACSNRSQTATYYTSKFPATPVPQAQTNLFPRQTGAAGGAGVLLFGWHDVSLKKVATVITYSVDGYLIATADTRDAGTPGGGNILFTFFDINSTGSTDEDSTNLLFALFDNVRITNFPSVVTVSAPSPSASEAGPTPGMFTISRNEPGPAVTVYYTVGGTAVNGTDYNNALGGPLSGTVTLALGATETNITIVPVDDGISELPETVILTITDHAGYVGAGSATVTIADNDPVTLDVVTLQPTMYERHPNDLIRFQLQRRGDLNSSVAGVNLTFSGTGFVPTNAIPVDFGAATAEFTISPIDNSLVTGPNTVTVTVAPGAGYVVGTTSPSASGTILDDENPPATVIYSNPLTSAGDRSNWRITYGTGDPVNLATNYNVDFGYDLTTDPNNDHGIIPLPPSGATKALRITCNKQVNPGAAGGVNVYLTNAAFSGNYSARFSMNVIQGGNLGTSSEGVLFGVNHTGSQSNWWYGSGPIAGGPWGSDGIWYYISANAGSDVNGDFEEFTGIGGTNGNAGWNRLTSKLASAFVNNFKNSPGAFTALNTINATPAGVPINGSPLISADASSWVDVEIKQINNIVSLWIDRTPVFTYTNTTVWTSGYLMLGYIDPYGAVDGSSVGNPDAAAYFSNLRVVRLGATLGQPALAGGNVTIPYTSPDGDDTVTSYTLQSASNAAGPYTDVTPAATFTQLSPGSFQAVTAQSGSPKFYRLRHN